MKGRIEISILDIYNRIILNDFSQINDLKLFSNFSDISTFLNKDRKTQILFLYLNRININEILYNEETFVNMKINKDNFNLKYFFFLSLLISENKNIVNYIYTIEFIKEANHYKDKIDDKEIYKKIIMAKIINELIDNYKVSDNYDDKEEEELNNIEIKNENIIDNNINNLKKINPYLNKNYIKNEKIDKIYLDIINGLLNKKNFSNIEFIVEVLSQLELESINITKPMIDEISKIINMNSDLINEYSIRNILDLFNTDKINFYYILFKFLLKNPIFIYQFPFIYETKRIIIENINKESSSFSSRVGKEIISRIEYIIEIITDSKYYFNKYKKKNSFINTYSSSIKKQHSTEIESEINNSSNDLDLNKSNDENKRNTEMKNKNPKIKNQNQKEKTKNEININNKEKQDKMKEETEQQSNNYPSTNLINNNKNIEKKLDNKDNKKNIKKEEYLYSVVEENKGSCFYNRYQTNSELKKFDGSEIESNNYYITINEINKYQIIVFNKIISTHKYTCEMIKEFNSQILLSFGGDKKVYFYEKMDNSKIKEYNCSDWINNIDLVKTPDKYNENPIICTNKCYDIIKSDKMNPYYFNQLETNLNFSFKINNDKYILIEHGKVSSLTPSFNNIIQTQYYHLLDGYYRQGIAIDKNIYAITSNRVIEGGDDKICFFNINSKKLFIEIKGYSFILSPSGLFLISMNNNNHNKNDENKLLLCACKKYLRNQKNGILLISNLNKINEKDKIKNSIKFYNTGNFNVHCFCQLSIIENISKENFSNSIIKTEYFLVGGFDVKKKRGIIKLYKIIKRDEIYEIERIQDIIIKHNNIFKGFKGPISFIEQSKSNGHILISSWDGNVYSFNLETFICFDK